MKASKRSAYASCPKSTSIGRQNSSYRRVWRVGSKPIKIKLRIKSAWLNSRPVELRLSKISCDRLLAHQLKHWQGVALFSARRNLVATREFAASPYAPASLQA